LENELSFKISIKTDGVWRVNQMSEALEAIDGLVTRVLVASKIAEVCQEFSPVISELQIFGLLEKGQERKWNEAKDPADIITRSDFAKFFSLLKNAGVNVTQREFGLKLNFTSSDLREIAPLSSRPEIERITMASPGEWLLIISSGMIVTKQGINLLTKIFDALFFHNKMRKTELREKEAKAKLEEIKANKEQLDLESKGMESREKQLKLFHDYTVAIDSLIASLRSVGFENDELKKIVEKMVTQDIDTISRYASLGNIENIKLDILN
jgi:hypothetical protein